VIIPGKKSSRCDTRAFQQRFNIEVRVQSESLAIDREKRDIKIKNVMSGEIYTEKYDFLVLAPRSSPLSRSWRVLICRYFTLRSIPDSKPHQGLDG